MKIITLPAVDSTNRYCELLDLTEVEEFTCYRAVEQTAGIGQRHPSKPDGEVSSQTEQDGETFNRAELSSSPSKLEGVAVRPGACVKPAHNPWFSGPAGENLAASIILKPLFLPAASQFHLTQAVALALCDLLSTFDLHSSVMVKWPNDIYVDGKKICGTLISTRLSAFSSGFSSSPTPTSLTSSTSSTSLTSPSALSTAICGIGLNVNQVSFPDWVPAPTSLALLTGHRHDVAALLEALLEACRVRYDQLRAGRDLTPEYLGRLMNLGVPRRYLYRGDEITATVTGVDPFGRLLLTAADGTPLCCNLKEIALVG